MRIFELGSVHDRDGGELTGFLDKGPQYVHSASACPDASMRKRIRESIAFLLTFSLYYASASIVNIEVCFFFYKHVGGPRLAEDSGSRLFSEACEPHRR